MLRYSEVAGERVLRMEPRARGVDYGPVVAGANAAMDREMRLAHNKKCAASCCGHTARWASGLLRNLAACHLGPCKARILIAFRTRRLAIMDAQLTADSSPIENNSHAATTSVSASLLPRTLTSQISSDLPTWDLLASRGADAAWRASTVAMHMPDRHVSLLRCVGC